MMPDSLLSTLDQPSRTGIIRRVLDLIRNTRINCVKNNKR